jgi:hypothetical protein
MRIEDIRRQSRGVDMGIDKEEDKTFADFMKEFLAKHAIVGPGSGKVTVIVTKEELMNLGRGAVQLFVGWGAGLEVVRAMRREIGLPEWFTPVSVDVAEEERPKLALVRESRNANLGGIVNERDNKRSSNTSSKRKGRHHR